MRNPASRLLLLLTLALFVGASGSRAWADDRAEARTHYQAGVKAYGTGDYKKAIAEFSAAQQLVPADLNNYNLALCYDKLGDAEPAIQYYRAFLDKQPNADKRPEIEASISRLEAALKSAAAKKAEEQRKADEARKAEEAKAAEEARKAEEARRVEAVPTAPTGPTVPTGPATAPTSPTGPATSPTGPATSPTGPATGAQVPVGVGSTGTPGTGQAVSTGDAQLDRVNAIDVNAIRDQRLGGQASGMVDPRAQAAGAPPAAGTAPVAGTAPATGVPPAGGVAQAPGPQGPQSTNGQPLPADKPKETPVYKKWWFWAVVGVSAYVVISIATESSQNPNAARTMLPTPGAHDASGGMTLWRF